MADNLILEALQKFLQENVASRIKLQKANANNVYELVNPAVHIGWVPKLLENINLLEPFPDYPCLMVSIVDGKDYGTEAGVNVRITFAVSNMGQYNEAGKFFPDYNGYKDLLNLKDLTIRELARVAIIGQVASIQYPYKWGVCKNNSNSYWSAWLTFRVLIPTLNYVPGISEQYK